MLPTKESIAHLRERQSFAQSYNNNVLAICWYVSSLQENQQNHPQIQLLYISTMYNLKHCIELYCKIVSAYLTWSHDWNHNIHELFQKAKWLYETNKVLFETKKEELKLQDLDVIEALDVSAIEQIPTALENVEPIVLKYYQVKDSSQLDEKNMYFRYPEKGIDYAIKWIKKSDFDDLHKDAWEIKRLLWWFVNIMLWL